MLARVIGAALVAGSLLMGSAQAADAPWAGAWDVVAHFKNGTSAASMVLSLDRDVISGSSGPLDEAGFWPLTVKGRQQGGAAELEFRSGDDPAGQARLRADGPRLAGEGTLYGVPVTFEARRPAAPSGPPKTHDFSPTTFQLHYSGHAEPALRITPGDTVRTTTLDNEGRDATLTSRGMPGNTLTGPFYVEGAMPGDTLVVHLVRVELNRGVAHMYSGALNPKAVQPDHEQTRTKGWGRTWTLDRGRGVARLERAGDRLAGLELPLKPMIGSIGVAPPLNQSLFAGDLGFHGGNLDYSRLTTGATLYLPVFQAGALLSLGDGHALQGDGEITGQGLETSLAVEFKVELIKGRSLGQIWSEDAQSVMVSGVDNTLESALQMATSGMARWLKDRYGLNDSEVAALLGAAVAYDIAEIVDARPHVVARLPKATLAMIRKP